MRLKCPGELYTNQVNYMRSVPSIPIPHPLDLRGYYTLLLISNILDTDKSGDTNLLGLTFCKNLIIYVPMLEGYLSGRQVRLSHGEDFCLEKISMEARVCLCIPPTQFLKTKLKFDKWK